MASQWLQTQTSHLCGYTSVALPLGQNIMDLSLAFSLHFLSLCLYIRTHSENTKEPKINQKALLYAFLFLAVTLVVFSPWTIRNYLWTGNPLYPLFKSFFSEAPAILSSGTEITSLTVRKLLYNESTLQVLLLPFRMFFEGKDNSPQFFDGQLSAISSFPPTLCFFQDNTMR